VPATVTDAGPSTHPEILTAPSGEYTVLEPERRITGGSDTGAVVDTTAVVVVVTVVVVVGDWMVVDVDVEDAPSCVVVDAVVAAGSSPVSLQLAAITLMAATTAIATSCLGRFL